ncbi:hypothetical protein BCR44DRAFT_1109396 [Catenaria anguillulae PL171]|uniref:Uncharacterized protein n=1 Tax=Catenaria anguillulae PL171 TaxID=765915 RepID=A0A1Y2HMT1_9FUNG|nr:hypothetical protein BCR44DRAFT_1109396 [Catenaria anguillulae PL171]
MAAPQHDHAFFFLPSTVALTSNHPIALAPLHHSVDFSLTVMHILLHIVSCRKYCLHNHLCYAIRPAHPRVTRPMSLALLTPPLLVNAPSLSPASVTAGFRSPN